MRNIRNLVAISATAAIVAIGGSVIAQDDLDDLLNDLAADTTAAEQKKVGEEPAQDEPAAEEPAADEPAGEEPAVADTDEPEPAGDEPAVADTDEPEPAGEEPAVADTDEPEPAGEEPAVADTPEPEPAGEEPADDDPLGGLDEAGDEPEGDGEEPAVEPATTTIPAEIPVTPAPATSATPAEIPVTPAPATSATPATPAVAATPAVSAPSEKDELLSAIDAVQRIRIKAFNEQADKEIAIARKCFENEAYLEMARHYHNAVKLLSENKASDSERKECEQGIADGLYRAALQEYATGRRERAFKLIGKAIDRRHPKARRQYEDWKAAGDPDANSKDISEIKHLRNDEEYKALKAKNNLHMKRAHQYFAQRNMKRALEEVELVLLTDEYNEEALRLRRRIQRKRQTILESEREAAREGMIADVDKAWRPVYAVDAREVEEVIKETERKPLDATDPERAVEQQIVKRMKAMRLPAISFKPPSTIIDAVEFFRQASKDFDDPSLPAEQRGFNFLLRLPEQLNATAEAESEEGGFSDNDDEEAAPATPGVPQIPLITVSDVSLYEALNLVCGQVGYKFKVKGPIVMVMHKNMSMEEMVTRSYPVLSSFMERMNTASSDMKEMQAGGFGSSARGGAAADDGEENQERDWKAFFELLGVKWPEGSSIMYIKTIGKLRVRNTYDNLAELEQALTEMNADPKLIEIETRFIEVCQEDLNSLGFEWILNSDYSLNIGAHASRALGLRSGVFGASSAATTSSSSSTSSSGDGTVQSVGGVNVNTSAPSTPVAPIDYERVSTRGADWIRYKGGSRRNVGINSTYDADGNTTYFNGTRYLSTLSNHVSGEGGSTNDQFMRINAFLGAADLSLILHMLSQRNDTDLLSAPKVLTQSGENAVMKVVTEFIYPTDYNVQLQSSSSSGNNYGGSSSTILAIVEPQSFTMREVGVVLNVTPTLTDDGNLIDLELDTQIVDEPTWKNYGMKIPFTGNASSLQNFTGIGDILGGLSDILTTLGTGISDSMKATFAGTAVDSATAALNNLTTSTQEKMTYYEAPMEQPFFHVRSVNSKLSVYPGATIVMGGLITEQRKAMDDKVPFLGDIPIIGRLFRSHSEWTNKRNLLIFVTTRLVDTRGRELQARGTRDEIVGESSITPAPAPEQ